MSNKKKATAISLPLSRTAKIMTSAVGVESVTPDIVAMATKATELFLMDLARRAYDQSSDDEFRSDVLEYDDIQKLVHSDPSYSFLIDTTPPRMKFSEALELVNQARSTEEAFNDQLNKKYMESLQMKEERQRKKVEKKRMKEQQAIEDLERREESGQKMDSDQCSSKRDEEEQENDESNCSL